MATADQVTLRNSLRVQQRVLSALLVREMLSRYGRHNIGFLWLFVEPIIFTLGVTALWTATKSVHGSDLPITAFALTGYSSVLLWRNMPGRLIGALWSNSSLMYHRNIRVMDIFIARLMIEFSGATISFFSLGLLFMSVGLLEMPEDFLQVISGWMLIAWFGVSLAITLGAIAYVSELVDKIWHPMSYLMFPLSGAAFLVSALPPFAQNIVLYIPVVHGVEFVREGFFGSRAKAIYNLEYMVSFCLVLSVIGLMLVRWVSRRVIPQ